MKSTVLKFTYVMNHVEKHVEKHIDVMNVMKFITLSA